MAKTLEQQFADWEAVNFGFGYGTGEVYILPALKALFAAIGVGPVPRTYDYRALEKAVGHVPAWLLINILCRAGIFEYGTSPRFGWLTKKGERLQDFLASKSVDELQRICCERTEDDAPCYPDACNCGPHGYERGRVCQNVFWLETPIPRTTP